MCISGIVYIMTLSISYIIVVILHIFRLHSGAIKNWKEKIGTEIKTVDYSTS